jgi:hypothetical protein
MSSLPQADLDKRGGEPSPARPLIGMTTYRKMADQSIGLLTL